MLTESGSILHHPVDRPPSLTPTLLVVFLLTLVLFTADILTPRLNVAVIYAIPLILLVRVKRRPAWGMAAVLVAATYLGYIIKWKLGYNEIPNFLNYRLLNRTFVAIALLLLCTASPLWLPPGAPETVHTRAYIDDFDQLFHSLLPAISVVAAIVATLLIAALDLFLPRNLNLPILYSVPLFIFGWTRSKTTIWLCTGLMLLLTLVGYNLGLASTTSLNGTRLVANRLVAASVLILVAGLLHASMGRRDKAQ